MKKTLAIILALALVFSSFTVAFAEEVLPADAAAVTGLGMLVGAGNGVTLDYLKVAPTRIQAAIMVLRLKGLEDDAKAFTGVDNFADANTAAWATPIMAYLKANPTLGFAGTGGANFEPNTVIDAKSYYKVMLETLGYKQNTTSVIGDFTFEGVFEFAATKGLSKIASVTSFTVNDLATATIEALKANVKGSEKTLAASLVDAKVITEAAAVAAGVYKTTPVVLAVESVTTDNLKQLTVKFNKEIKEAGDEGNYELTVDDDSETLLDEESDFALQADKKTVVITLTHVAAQQEVVELAIEDIEAVDGSKLADTVVKDIELFDKTIPTVVAAKVVGNDTIKVTFSEPMMTVEEDDFEVDGGDYIIDTVVAANDEETEWNINLYSTLEEGKLELEVGTGIEDYAGYGTAKKTFELTVVEDKTAPVVVGYKDADQDEVTLIFNEDIQWVDGEKPAMGDNFYHTNTSNDASDASIKGNELTLTFTEEDGENELPEGTAYIYVVKEMIADLWDNENTKIAYTIEVTLDKTAPTVTKVEGGDDETQLEITFSEDMDVDTAEDVDNYAILDKDGKAVSDVIISAELTDTDVVTITFDDDMTGDHSVVIENVEDLAGNEIVKVTKAFNITDVTEPDTEEFTAKLYNASAKGQMIKVTFGEAMAVEGKYSVLDLEKYNYDNHDIADFEGVTIKAVDGNKAVEIKIPSHFDDADDYTDLLAGGDLVIARVADAAGNYTLGLVNPEITLLNEGSVAIDRTADYSARVTAANTIVVTLVDKLTKFYAEDFVIESDGVAILPARVRHTINADGLSTVTFTLAEADEVNTNATTGTLASGDVITVRTLGTTRSENIYGEKLATGDTVTLIDKAKPVFVSAEFVAGAKLADGTVTTYSTIVLTFSEELNPATLATAVNAKNGFSVSGGTLKSALINGSDATQVILTSTSDFFTVNTNVYYNAVAGIRDAIVPVRNTVGNTLADFSETDKLE
jgi:hypothetical protein